MRVTLTGATQYAAIKGYLKKVSTSLTSGQAAALKALATVPASWLVVLGNKMVFGTVSSNRGHFERSIQSLASMEQKWPGWLSKLITRRLRLDNFKDALDPAPDNIKTVIELT